MNTYFFLLVLQFMMTPIVHCTSSFACLKRMRWNERVYAREKERERERVQLSHTYKRPSSVCLSRHISYRWSKGKKGKTFFSLSLSYSSLPLNVSLLVSQFIQSSVMPSLCLYCSLFQSVLIILMISFEKTLSTNDNQHQILKADVGQDVTMSCIFDEDKIEQVRKQKRKRKFSQYRKS